jgi:thioester reductase-like protein
MNRTVLLTGFPSTLLARLLLQRIVEREPDSRVLVLTPRAQVEQANAQIARLDEAAKERVEIVLGDTVDMDFGLSGQRFMEIARTVDVIHHCAFVSYASARRELAERVNVAGTGEVLELAEEATHLSQLVVWSSALVGPSKQGRVFEGDLRSQSGFPSAVEETRFRAEKMVRDVVDHVPTTVLRPAIIVGDSRTGEIDRMEGPYLLVQLMLSSPVDLRVPLPGRGDVPLHLVPIDYVVNAGHTIANDARSIGRTFHLVDEHPLTARRVFELIAEACGRPGPVGGLPTQLASALLCTPGLERFSHIPRAFLEQLAVDVTYDARNTRELLTGTGIECPRASSYLTVMVDYVRSEQQKKAAHNSTRSQRDAEVDDPLN